MLRDIIKVRDVMFGPKTTSSGSQPSRSAMAAWASAIIASLRALVEQAGLHILSAREETAAEDGQPITFLWVIAQKAGD